VADRTVSLDLLGRDKTGPAFKSASRSASRFEGQFSKLGGTLAKFGRRAGLGLGIAAAAGGALGLKIAASNEQAQISFTTMLGSAKKASKFLHQLQAFAAKTPFEFPELQTAASSLISAGFQAKQVIPIMTTLGDVTSGMGTGSEGIKRATVALQQMSAAGKITGQDLNQLRDAGIPVFDLLASATGKSKAEISKLAAAGKLGKTEMKQLFDALEHGGGGLKRFSGLMDKQSESLMGLWSTFKDTLGQGLAKAIQPMIPTIKRGLKGASTLIADALAGIPAAVAKIKDIGGPIVQKIKDALPLIKAALGAWATAMVDVFKFVKIDVAPVVTRVIYSLKVGIEQGNWSYLGPALGNALAKALKGAGAAVGAIGSALGALLAKVDWIGLGIALGKQAIPLLVGLALGILNVDLGKLLVGLAQHWKEALFAVITLALLPEAILGKIATLLAKIPFAGTLLSWGFRAFARFSKALTGMVGRALGFMGRAFIEGFRRVFPAAGAALSHGLALLPTRIGVAAISVVQAAKRMMTRLGGAIAGGVHGVVAKIGQLIAGMLRPFAGAGSWLINAGKQVIQGLIDGIGAMFGAVKNKLGDLTGKLTSWKGPPSKDRKILFPAGVMIMEGLNAGIVHGSGKIKKTLQTLTQNLGSHLSDLRSQARDIASSAADSVRGILDVSGIGAPGTSPSGILKGFAAQAGAFAKALAKMAKIGLAPAIIAAVAAAGPSALGAANAFASESKAQVRSDNASVAAINRAALQVGATARGSSGLDKKIDETNHLLRQLHRVLAGDKVASLRITDGGDLIVTYVNKKNHHGHRRGHQ
jgi:tape measure domain-containing protein